jgi:hypothetical protein
MAFNYRPIPSQATHPGSVQVTPVNVNNNQIGIFWKTDKPEVGWVIYGKTENNLDKIAYDERDVGSTRKEYRNHYALMKDLTENTTYYYKVISDNQIIEDSEKKAFMIQSPAKVSTVTNLKPAYGQVINTNGTPLENGIVLLTIGKSYPLLSVTKITGEFLLSLQTIISKDTNAQLTPGENESVELEIYDENKKKTSIKAQISTINPLPRKIVLGENYTFMNEEKVLAAETIVKKTPTAATEIIYPKDNAVVSTGLPLIKGTSTPNSDLDVTLSLSPKKSTSYGVHVDNKGGWKLDLTTPLSEGKYTLTVTSKTEEDPIPVKRSFSITRVGQQVLGQSVSATPSGTLSPTSAPINTPTIAYVSPTSAPLISPTTSLYSPTPPPPVSGVSVLPVTAISIALLTLGLGIFLAF